MEARTNLRDCVRYEWAFQGRGHTGFLGQWSRNPVARVEGFCGGYRGGGGGRTSGQMAPQPRLTQEPQGICRSQRSFRLGAGRERGDG